MAPISTSSMNVIRENLNFFIKVVLPVASFILLTPMIFNPATVEAVKTNIRIVIFSKSMCELDPEACEANLGYLDQSPVLVKSEFKDKEFVYIRPYFVKHFEWLMVKILEITGIKKLLASKNGIENPDEMIYFVIAFFNTILFNTIRGMVITRLHVYSALQFLLSVGEGWFVASKTFWTGLKSLPNVL